MAFGLQARLCPRRVSSIPIGPVFRQWQESSWAVICVAEDTGVLVKPRPRVCVSVSITALAPPNPGPAAWPGPRRHPGAKGWGP